MIDAAALEETLSKNWGLRVHAAVTDKVYDAKRLTPSEQMHLAGLSTPKRQTSWLLGRSALKDLLAALRLPEDTTALRFPNPRVSLSHSGGWAIAIGTDAPLVAGIGVDLELRPPPRVETARFFMSPEELPRLEKASPKTLLRVWTIKEAVFKADPDNALTSVRAYRLQDPDAPAGAISVGTRTFRYRTFEIPGGFLTAALLKS
jgi:4'-phosphopantetheinyl transferase EntD